MQKNSREKREFFTFCEDPQSIVQGQEEEADMNKAQSHRVPNGMPLFDSVPGA